jgi:hypothetical protein
MTRHEIISTEDAYRLDFLVEALGNLDRSRLQLPEFIAVDPRSFGKERQGDSRVCQLVAVDEALKSGFPVASVHDQDAGPSKPAFEERDFGQFDLGTESYPPIYRKDRDERQNIEMAFMIGDDQAAFVLRQGGKA